jgi:hypothetical protein
MRILNLASFMGMVAVLAACEGSEAQGRRLTDVLRGVWDWEAAPNRCQENPHSISFPPGGGRMEIRHPKGAVSGNEAPQVVTVYRILAEESRALRMEIIGETRKTERGDLVVWDLRLLSDDSYCWHRTDWPPQGCTGRVLRCPLPR